MTSTARRASVLLVVAAAALGFWAWRGRERPAPPPSPVEAPVDEAPENTPRDEAPEDAHEAPAPPRHESPAEFVERLLGMLAETQDASPDVMAAEIADLIDAPGFAREATGTVWSKLSPAQQAQVTSNLRDIVLAKAVEEGMKPWLHDQPRVVEADAGGPLARVRTVTEGREHFEVTFVLTRRAEGFAVRDMKIEGVGVSGAYRHQLERLVARNGGDAGDMVWRIAEKARRKRAGQR